MNYSRIYLPFNKIIKAATRLDYIILLYDKFFDKRNYIVGSKNFKKIFGNNFKFSSFNKEILNLKKNMLKHKISVNIKTIRMKFYKKLFH